MSTHTPFVDTRRESSLHRALKEFCCQAGDVQEANLSGLRVDILHGNTLIEVQTGNFSALKDKLARLLPDYAVRIVYPLATQKWIVRQSAAGQTLARRKSPKRGALLDVFYELVYIAEWLVHPNLSVDVLFVQQEEVWRDDGKGSWRRKHWSIHDRRLLDVSGRREFHTAADYCALLPDVSSPFTSRGLANAMQVNARLGYKIVYTLWKAGCLERVGQQGRARLYRCKLTAAV